MKRVKKENKEKIMDGIKKAGSDEYVTSWDEKGVPKSKKKSEVKKGRVSRARGARFELKARESLEKDGWILDKWTNNVDLENNILVKAKRKYNPFKKMLVVGTGFPDFIGFKLSGKKYDVIGIEAKINGLLSKIEKEKCKWYLKNKIFSKIYIAKAKKIGRKIEVGCINFEKKYGK
ncbi:MAG: hypothetical protein ABIH59_01155 [archaeon]